MDLINLLPGYYQENKTMKEIQRPLTSEIDCAKEAYNSFLDECFISTTTKLISRFENIYGIKTDISKGLVARRSKVMAKMAGKGTFTKEALLETTQAFPGGASEIVEDINNYKFRIKFNDYNRVPDESSINEIYAVVDELKPAHLDYDHTYTYNWWGMADTGTWNDGGTWDDLRNYKEA